VSYEAGLAAHLSEQEAAMYGAFWCPHCSDQKAMFGDAEAQIPYVECDPEGEAAQPQLCRDKGIQGYPTWEIEGQLYPGVRSLQELADLSGYPAPPE
jgi:glutaredoxin